MKFTLFLLAGMLGSFVLQAQSLYFNTFGDRKNKPIIFLHGGPGSNSGSFELTTAQKLADKGYYVILYDRRGEGRSIDIPAKYTFQQTFNDLNNIYKKFGLKKATLIGYSFGGLLGILYMEKYSQQVSSLVLISSLCSLQDTYNNILEKSERIFEAKNDTANLRKLKAVAAMNRSSIDFRANCFAFATLNGFFDTPHPNELSVKLNQMITNDTVLMRMKADTSNPASVGFWRNEKYTMLNIYPKIKTIQQKHVNVYAIYGKDDGLFSEDQVNKVRAELSSDAHLKYFDNCSHPAFIDQQELFLEAVSNWIK
ncbi:alpha/beta hydrolase [Chitinophaga sp.]|uniref:alpha/beta hydrolase n=1 Tax=Chitinophaga sp. TaxID=1869181 RepID=UPI0031D0A83E